MKLSDYTKAPEEERPQQTASILLQGFSGVGKTGSVIALAVPDLKFGSVKSPMVSKGRKLFVANTEGPGKFSELAIEVLKGMVKTRKITQEQMDGALENIEFEDIHENIGPKINKITGEAELAILSKPQGWKRLMKVLNEWSSRAEPHDVLVLDSFTQAALSLAVAHFLANTGTEWNRKLNFNEYPLVQANLRKLLEYLPRFPSHTIVTCHPEKYEVKRKDVSRKVTKPDGSVEYGEEIVDAGLSPISVGQAGRMQIPAAYNHMLIVDVDSNSGARKIYTKPRKSLNAKSPLHGVSAEYEVADGGLAEYLYLADPY